jgi:hypothetical protein
MASSTFKDIFEDIDIIINNDELDFEFDADFLSLGTDKSLTDQEIQDILDLSDDESELAVINETPPTNIDKVTTVESEQPKPPKMMIEDPAPKEASSLTLPEVQTLPVSTSAAQTQTSLYAAIVIKPPAYIDVRFHCRQDVRFHAPTLFLGSFTVPYLSECLRHSRTYQSIMNQGQAYVSTLRPFSKLKPFYSIVLQAPIYTFVTDKGTPYTLPEKSVPLTYASWVPMPFYSGESVSLTFTAVIDILPFACKNASQAQMFGPTQNISPFSRLGPPKRAAPACTSSKAPSSPKPKKGKRARISHP